MNLRAAQAKILKYKKGQMGVSAVPGSGKTFTLTQLVVELLKDGRIQPENGESILIVTYLNSSVDTFKARIRQQLEQASLPLVGFDVRTLHSLGLEVIKLTEGGISEELPDIIDEGQNRYFLAQAIDSWIDQNQAVWLSFLPQNTIQMRARWRETTERTAKSFIAIAKNERFTPDGIQKRIQEESEREDGVSYPLVWMLAGIYAQYQTILYRQGAYDFNDLIWQAVVYLQERADLAQTLQRRWPYILEDEAQDSVPLQEQLLGLLTGEKGNLVRVGDPNQAITSSFTSAHPKFFNAFLDRKGVVKRPLPNSGRCAPIIFNAANELINWTTTHHPVLEVREHCFRAQKILPTPKGDAQPNPLNSEAGVGMRVHLYEHRELQELPRVGDLAIKYMEKYPKRTVAILSPTHYLGHQIAERFDDLKVPYDNLLKGGGHEREIAGVLQAILGLLANPLDREKLADVHESLSQLEHPVVAGEIENMNQFQILLKSIYKPELLLFPTKREEFSTALPEGIATEQDIRRLARLSLFFRRIFALRPLPIDDLVLSIADELFAYENVRESNLAIAYQIANLLRQWQDTQPEWRLPELAAQLGDVATGRRSLPGPSAQEMGYEPVAGRITLITQHGAKGLEWDAVFIIAADDRWFPSDLDSPFQGVDAILDSDSIAEAKAQLMTLMSGESGIFPGRSATESAHIDLISERLRLLYVGMTRAKRFLQISRSKKVSYSGQDQKTEPSNAVGAIYQHLNPKE